jgi:hypothetical protein
MWDRRRSGSNPRWRRLNDAHGETGQGKRVSQIRFLRSGLFHRDSRTITYGGRCANFTLFYSNHDPRFNPLISFLGLPSICLRADMGLQL